MLVDLPHMTLRYELLSMLLFYVTQNYSLVGIFMMYEGGKAGSGMTK